VGGEVTQVRQVGQVVEVKGYFSLISNEIRKNILITQKQVVKSCNVLFLCGGQSVNESIRKQAV
jgi:hypothetical protein